MDSNPPLFFSFWSTALWNKYWIYTHICDTSKQQRRMQQLLLLHHQHTWTNILLIRVFKWGKKLKKTKIRTTTKEAGDDAEISFFLRADDWECNATWKGKTLGSIVDIYVLLLLWVNTHLHTNQSKKMKGHYMTEVGSMAAHRIAPQDKRVLGLIPALGLSIWWLPALISFHSPKRQGLLSTLKCHLGVNESCGCPMMEWLPAL